VARTEIEIGAPPETVWDVLADARAYGEWVVGTKGITRADADWPRVGTALEYEVGFEPFTVGDRTEVLKADRPQLLVLRAELQRLGAAMIRLELEPLADGTHVVMDEEPVDGVAGALHNRLTDGALARRNDVALGRLKRLAEARA
jgi:uncharacterized protein YndB with AHSA1/START domain